MQRRKFVQSLGTLTALSPLANNAFFLHNWMTTNDLIEIFTKGNDERVTRILTTQALDKNHRFYGGFSNAVEIYHPISAAGYISNLIAAFVSPSSQYYQANLIKERLNLAIDFLLKSQHETGRIDLISTNFDSAPDTAFAVEPLGQALMILKKYLPDNLQNFQQKATIFLKKAGDGMSSGGIHTPNHRWVICRALARLQVLFPNPKYTARIHQWLGEGIDIDSDGQYNEKSSAGYSPMVNHCLITAARLLNKPALYDPVRKNLDMMCYLVHANGEVVTELSKRQDKYTIANMGRYYYAYRHLALLDNNSVYAAMTQLIEETVGIENLSGNLSHFLEETTLNSAIPKPTPLPTNYVKHFPASKMARIRRDEVDATILGENYSFFTFFKGNAILQAVRVATAFFGKGQFVSPSLRIEDGQYILTQELTGPYYQPHLKENIAADGDWEKMPRSLRPKSEIQELKSIVRITESNGEFAIHFDIQGTDYVPLAVELAFRSGGQFTGVEAVPDIEKAYILEKGFGEYQFDNQTITFGPGHKKHAWTQLRGAKPKLNGDSVYLTGYTPFTFTLTVK